MSEGALHLCAPNPTRLPFKSQGITPCFFLAGAGSAVVSKRYFQCYLPNNFAFATDSDAVL
jgi:hypothetical protein